MARELTPKADALRAMREQRAKEREGSRKIHALTKAAVATEEERAELLTKAAKRAASYEARQRFERAIEIATNEDRAKKLRLLKERAADVNAKRKPRKKRKRKGSGAR